MTVTQFESLLKTHGSTILGFCRHLTGNEVSAQDLYQDTLLKAFSKLAKINCDTTEEMLSAKNYLIGIAVRLYQNQKRRKMNYETSFTDDVEDMLYAEENVIDESEQKELYIAVRKAVDALPEKLRIVTFMFYYADMDLSEIAHQLKIPQGTVKSRLNRARTTIREHLKENGYEGF